MQLTAKDCSSSWVRNGTLKDSLKENKMFRKFINITKIITLCLLQRKLKNVWIN